MSEFDDVEMAEMAAHGITTDRLVALASGNPGAITALVNILKSHSPEDAAEVLSVLEAEDIRGSYIWVGYKDHCDGDPEAFGRLLTARDEALFETIDDYRELRGEA